MPELLDRIDRLNEIGIALSAESDTPKLLELIMMSAMGMLMNGTNEQHVAGIDVKLQQVDSPVDAKPANILYKPESDKVNIIVADKTRFVNTNNNETRKLEATPSRMLPGRLAYGIIDKASETFLFGVMLYLEPSRTSSLMTDSTANPVFRITGKGAEDILYIRNDDIEDRVTIVPLLGVAKSVRDFILASNLPVRNKFASNSSLVSE